jgi:hypothetical protein
MLRVVNIALLGAAMLFFLLIGLSFLAVQQVWPQPQVVSCQIGQPDMYVRVSPGFLTNDPEVDPSYEFGLPGLGACGIYYYDRPNRD